MFPYLRKHFTDPDIFRMFETFPQVPWIVGVDASQIGDYIWYSSAKPYTPSTSVNKRHKTDSEPVV
jgi:hypothetical protein